MNTAASRALTETPRPQPDSVPGAQPTASGRAVTAGQDVRVLVPASMPGACGPLPGSTFSSCPVLVLEMVFRKLNISDLTACSQVCRHWCQVANDRRVQLSCLRRTFLTDHRLQMERALDSQLLRASLMPWYEAPATEAEPESAAVAKREPSPGQLLCRALQKMLLTKHFYPGVCSKSTLLRGTMHDIACNLDGRLIASLRRVRGTPGSSINLWQDTADQVVVRPGADLVSARVLRFQFSSDGGKLRVLYGNGMVQVWQPHPEGGWYIEPGPARLLFGLRIRKSVLSPDGKRLAVMHEMWRVTVRIHCEEARGDWDLTPELNLLDPLGAGVLDDVDTYDPDRVLMQFSDDGRHFVFGFEHDLGIWTRLGRAWQRTGEMRTTDPLWGQPVFDAQSRMLVLGCCCDGDQGFVAPVELLFYRRQEVSEQEVRWTPVRQLGGRQFQGLSTGIQAGDRLAVAFSPDAELMACPHYSEDCRAVFVVPVSGPGAWWQGTVLRSEEEHKEQVPCGLVSSLQFSASSCYLAAGADRVVTLWGRYPSWQALLRINNTARHTAVPFVFSPDGFHCLCVTSGCPEGPDRVRIWGPVSAGGYGCKWSVTLQQGSRVEKVLFTPDATRLVMAVYYRRPVWEGSSECKGFRMGSRLFYYHLSPTKLPRPESEPAPAAEPVWPDLIEPFF